MLTQRQVNRTYPPQMALFCSKPWMQVHRRQQSKNDEKRKEIDEDEKRKRCNDKLIVIKKLISHASVTLKNRCWVLLENFLGSKKVGCILDEVKTLYDTPDKFHDGQLVKPKNGSPTASIRILNAVHIYKNMR
uniref:Uncharacterized protein n=1 Tax=Romanomermis culicivorax TaxID=13658 RepID=A0A915KZI9_ROMCU